MRYSQMVYHGEKKLYLYRLILLLYELHYSYHVRFELVPIRHVRHFFRQGLLILCEFYYNSLHTLLFSIYLSKNLFYSFTIITKVALNCNLYIMRSKNQDFLSCITLFLWCTCVLIVFLISLIETYLQ